MEILSPSLNKPIGLAYVPASSEAPGSGILIDVRGKQLRGVVVKLPFLQQG